MEKHIGYEISMLSNLIRRKLAEAVPITEGDALTGMQGKIMDYIYVNSKMADVFQRDVEEHFSIRRSTASRILQTLEQKGIVIRESVPHDARLKKLVLTAKAIESHEKIKAELEAFEAVVSKGLTEEDVRMFFCIAEKIKRNIE